MSNKHFIEALVDDFDKLNLADKVSNDTMLSIDGEYKVEFDVMTEDGKNSGLSVFINGDHMQDIEYDSETFNDDLMLLLSAPLNF